MTAKLDRTKLVMLTLWRTFSSKRPNPSEHPDTRPAESWKNLLPTAAERARLAAHPALAGGCGCFAYEAYSVPDSELAKQTAKLRHFLRAHNLEGGSSHLYSGFEIKLAFNRRTGEGIPTAVLIVALILEGYDVTWRGKAVYVWLNPKPELHAILEAIQQEAIAVMNASLVNVPGGVQTEELI